MGNLGDVAWETFGILSTKCMQYQGLTCIERKMLCVIVFSCVTINNIRNTEEAV